MSKKPTVTTISSGYYSTTALNNNFTNIRNEFDNTLSLDGSTPNAMQADLDFNNNNAVNIDSLDAQTITLAGSVTDLSDIQTLTGISQDIQTLADIEDGTAALNAIQTAASVSSDITTVSGISADVSTVSGISSNVTTVANNDANVTTVANNEANITTVANNDTNITTVANDIIAVTTNATNIADINTVAANVTDVTNFADVYLGPVASDPTTRNDGSALQEGDLYFNTTSDEMRTYEGTSWVAAFVSLSGALLSSNNLSDVDDPAAALSNLGLTASTADEIEAAQGYAEEAKQALADAEGRVINKDTIAALTALDTSVLPDGQQVSVAEFGGVAGISVWQWDSAATDTEDNWTIIAPDAGSTGRWFLKSGTLEANITVAVPGDFATLQDAFDRLSLLRPGGRIITINIETGHAPASGVSIPDGALWGHFNLTSTDALVSLSSGFTDTHFMVGSRCQFPKISASFDFGGYCTDGIYGVNMAVINIVKNVSLINATGNNLHARASSVDFEMVILDGAGNDGARITQGSIFKGQVVRADNCGNAGVEISRGSTGTVMEGRARNCGLVTRAADPTAVQCGSLVVRRSKVTADRWDGQGSVFAVSASLDADINAVDVDGNSCTVAAIRASGAVVRASNGTLTNCPTGVSLGFGAYVFANSANFTGCTSSYVLFGSGATLDITDATLGGAAGGGQLFVNSPSPAGTVWDNGKPNVPVNDWGPFQLVLDPDEVATITPPGSGGGRGLIVALSTGAFGVNGLAWLRVTNSNAEKLAGGTNFVATTGALTATSGSSGEVIISAHTDGLIYLVNRTIGTQYISVTILTQSIFDS